MREQIILTVARQHGLLTSALSETERAEMERLFAVSAEDLEPRVYYRLTDNWLELTVRFFAKERGVRAVKDAMSRDILRALTWQRSESPRRPWPSWNCLRYESIQPKKEPNRKTESNGLVPKHLTIEWCIDGIHANAWPTELPASNSE